MDLFSRKIVGWQIADSMTAELVIVALKRAILRERLPAGMIVCGYQFSDRKPGDLAELFTRAIAELQAESR